MKLKLIMWLCFVAFTSTLVAQTPDLINYQAIVRDANNTVITNQSVSIKFIITEGLPNGLVIYEENQSSTTNSHGLINIKIGSGLMITGTLDAIDWSANSYYLTTSIDPTGAANYTLSGISELVSVPYALHAKTVENADDADADPENEIQDLQLNGSNLSISNNLTATVIDLSNLIVDTQLNEAAVDGFVSNNGYITSEIDGSITNEIELPAGGINGQILQTNGSGTYTWVNKTVDTDTQLNEAAVDAFVADNGYITTEIDGSITNEIELPVGGSNGQVLQTNGSGTYTWVNQSTDADADPTNEIELPVGGTNGQVLATNGTGTYTWINQNLDTDTQLNEAAVDALVANNGYLTSEVDGSITNEIQTLSISGSDLTISGSGGNTITLPSGSSGYKIGQQLDGGTIIFVDSTGLHGKIAANTDLAGTYAYQSDGPTQVSGAISFYDGSANTAALAAAGGVYNAADACAALGDGNWYLPSYSEFILMYNNLHILSGFDFSVAIYWTSTTTTIFGGATGASYYLTGSSSLSQTVDTASKVRAMRQF
jgi:hypothetical protein